MFLVETKGREDIDLPRKDTRAIKWCEDATRLTDNSWSYLKTPNAFFGELLPLVLNSSIGSVRLYSQIEGIAHLSQSGGTGRQMYG